MWHNPSWVVTDVNVSTYSLSSQISGVVECHSILLQWPEWDCGPHRLWLQGLSMVMGIEQKVDHLNPASWVGDMQVSSVQLVSAWKSGWYQIESDPKLAMFNPTKTFNTLESMPGDDLLNPFRTEEYKEHKGEETYDGMSLHIQSNLSTPPVPDTLELEELIDHVNAQKKGMESMVDVGDGKHIHKAKVLCEFTRFTRTSNSTDHLRHITNISHFTQPLSMQPHHICDDSITETNCLLIQDLVAVLLWCLGAWTRHECHSSQEAHLAD